MTPAALRLQLQCSSHAGGRPGRCCRGSQGDKQGAGQLRGEALTLRMAAVSSISAMKVDRPRIWQSPAPTRAYSASRTEMRASEAGTKLQGGVCREVVKVWSLVPLLLTAGTWRGECWSAFSQGR